ncbi:MAG: serine/threonine-protein kinase [bacterium]
MATLEGYEIFAELNRGPWVAIYKAFDTRRHRTVLVKMLLDAGAPAVVLEQLRVEGDLRQHLSHPNLRAIYGSGKMQDREYLVLEYVEGPTLAELITQNLPVELCVWIAGQVAQALAVIHRQGILHRDLKPQNIFVSQHGEVKLGDLGLAVDRNDVSANLAGTPAYFSPELILGQNVSARSDLFSLGAVLYEMLTAAAPFADHSTPAILHRIANMDPMPAEKLRPEIPGELAALCRKLLAKNPEHRCGDAQEIIALCTQFEHNHQLKLSAKTLAQFLHQPEAYPRAIFKPDPPYASHRAAFPPSTLEKFTETTKKRRFVPVLFVASILCGFILMNFENRATDRPPAASTPQLTPSRQDPKLEAAPAPAQIAQTATASLLSATEALLAETGSSPPAPDHHGQTLPVAAVERAATPAALAKEENHHAPSVMLFSEPRAHVFAENDSLGLTPVRWTPGRPEQVYELRFVSPSLPQVNKLITAAILESDTLVLDLWQEFAYLDIAVHPWGEIWIDGRPVDTTPLAAPLTLTPGLHELDVRHPQLGIRSQRLVLAKGDTLRKVVNLLAP